VTYRLCNTTFTQVRIKLMTYVPKHHGKPLKEPKSAYGHVWRFQMLSKRIDGAAAPRSRIMYRLQRSVNLMKAERLGAARFQDVCSRLAISNEVIELHRRIAANAWILKGMAGYLPDNEEALSIATDIDSNGLARLPFGDRNINPRMSLDDLRDIVRRSKNGWVVRDKGGTMDS
jgi:hypothetical protein